MKLKHEDEIYDLGSMGKSDLLDLKLLIEMDIDSIQMQIREANVVFHATGQRSDPEWYHKAVCARKIKSKQVQMLQNELGRRNRERKNKVVLGRQVSDYFVDICKENMKPSQYIKILEGAKRRHQIAMDEIKAAQAKGQER